MLRFLTLLLLMTTGLALPAAGQDATTGGHRSHALAEFSTPLYGPDFPHFPYVNPAAPKGGTLVLAEQGTFDNLNGLILRGIAPRSLGMIDDGLMAGSGDELDVLYGAIAHSVDYPDDKSGIVFHLRPEARWHDGHPLTADDFVFGWEAIRAHGNPFLRSFLDDTESVEAVDPYQLKVSFRTRNSMKPLVRVAAALGPQPRHWWSEPGRDISRTTLEIPLGCGPYRLVAVDPGRSLTYQRVPDYWGAGLPVNIGQNNFDTIRIEYFRDDEVMFEAFKAGTYDHRQENKAQRWTGGYQDVPAFKDGRIVRQVLENPRPSGAQGLRFNTRRPHLADPRVREALNLLFDFDWTRKNLLYGQYKRVKSNFPNSDFGASGPPTPEERAILEKYRDQLHDPRILTEAFEPPGSQTPQAVRANARRAQELFKAAGWEVRDGRLTRSGPGPEGGAVFQLEIMEQSQTMVRVLQPYIETLRRFGIDAGIRMVDAAQAQVRSDAFDFDAVVANYNFFPPPGTELRSYYGSAAADQQGSANTPGIKDPVVDALIETIIAAPDLPTLKAASRALDRVLLWGFYMVPQWYNDQVWFAFWDKFGWPETKPYYGTGFPGTWWHDPVRASRLGKGSGAPAPAPASAPAPPGPQKP